MRVGIDACTWSNRRGYGRFTRELVTRMVLDHTEHRFVLVIDQHTAREARIPEGAEIRVVATRAQPTQAASANGSRSPVDLWRMSRVASRLAADVFLFPTSYSFYPLFSRTPTVVVIHDATAEHHPNLIFPGFRSRMLWAIKTRLALGRADRLVTVSEDARTQIAAAFRYPAAVIDVVPEAPDSCFRPLEEPAASAVLARYRLPADVPLILYVGGISPHKNLQGLLRAMPLVDRPIPRRWHLVLVGDYQGDSFWSCHQELVELARSLELADRLSFPGYIPDEDLLVLYNAATMLVLPSLSEGFGLPVVEAMACGLPVAVSDRTSLPEIVGSGGLLFDPLSPTQIAAAIKQLLDDPALRADLRAKGLRRAAAFSWQASARKMVRIFEEVALVDHRRRFPTWGHR